MKSYIPFILLFSILNSCSVFDKDEDIPSFISIDSVAVNINSDQEGSDSFNIPDVKVSVNGENIGIFSIPAVIPVLSEGSTDITIAAVIKQDGIGSTRFPYPFYQTFTTTESLSELDTVSISPEFIYYNSIEFWPQEFENSTDFIPGTNSGGEMGITHEASLVFENNGSGMVELESDASYFILETAEDFQWPVGSAVFLEMDYSANSEFYVGAEALFDDLTIGVDDLVGINATTSGDSPVWNKIYINLTDFIFNNSSAQDFEIFLRGFVTPGSDTQFYFDNIKILHFEN